MKNIPASSLKANIALDDRVSIVNTAFNISFYQRPLGRMQINFLQSIMCSVLRIDGVIKSAHQESSWAQVAMHSKPLGLQLTAATTVNIVTLTHEEHLCSSLSADTSNPSISNSLSFYPYVQLLEEGNSHLLLDR